MKPKNPRKSTSFRQRAVFNRNFRKGRMLAILSQYRSLCNEITRDGGTIKIQPINPSLFLVSMETAIESAYAAQCKLHPRKQDCPAPLDTAPTT